MQAMFNHRILKLGLMLITCVMASGCDRVPTALGLQRSPQAFVQQNNAPVNYAQEFVLKHNNAPSYIHTARGFYPAEAFGRWTSGRFALVGFTQNLPDRFEFEINLAPSKANAAKTATLWLGAQAYKINLPEQAISFTTHKVTMVNPQKESMIVIEVADPRSEFELTGQGDQRTAGLAIATLKIRPLPKS